MIKNLLKSKILFHIKNSLNMLTNLFQVNLKNYFIFVFKTIIIDNYLIHKNNINSKKLFCIKMDFDV